MSNTNLEVLLDLSKIQDFQRAAMEALGELMKVRVPVTAAPPIESEQEMPEPDDTQEVVKDEVEEETQGSIPEEEPDKEPDGESEDETQVESPEDEVAEENGEKALDSTKTGAMIALVPENPGSIAIDVENAIEPNDIHMTVSYLGEAEGISSADKEFILKAANEVTKTLAPLKVGAFGIGLFNPNDENACSVLLLDATDVCRVINELQTNIYGNKDGVKTIPHVTLAYNVSPETLDKAKRLLPMDITFNKLRVAFGGEVIDFDLGRTLVLPENGFEGTPVE